MKRRKIEEIGVSSRGRYMRNIADIPTKRKDIRIADIILIKEVREKRILRLFKEEY